MTGRNLALLAGAAGAGAWLALRLYREANAFNFRDKAVLVTGGSRGLGLILARQLVAAGARVLICARDADELRQANDDLAGHGGLATTLTCDLTDAADVARMVAEAECRSGGLDVLINNAGSIGVGPLEHMRLEDFHQAMDANFYGAVHTILAALPGMRRRGRGRIVNVTSIGGKVSVPHLLPYCASKFALVGLSEGLRSELLKDGIVVTTICPGLMRTGSPRNANFKGRHREEYAWFAIGDSLPFFSMHAERAAAQILAACRRGDAEATLSLPAQCAVLFHGVFPGLTSDLNALVNRLLPGPGGVGGGQVKGRDSHSEWAPSLLTAATEKAARENNEMRATNRP